MADPIVPNVVVSMPSQLFTLARSFKAAANGKIYIGKIDTDPTIPENQIQVYVQNEDDSLVPIAQPIVINTGGYPVYGGQISKFVTVEGHSMAVYDAYNVQQFFFPNVLKYEPDQLRRDLANPVGSPIVAPEKVKVPFPFGTLADLLVDVTPTMWKHLKVGNDWSAAINACIQYAVDNYKRVILPQEFTVGSSVILPSRTTMHGFGVSVSKITALPGFGGDIVKSKNAPEIDYLTQISPANEVYSLSLRDFSIVGNWESDAATPAYIGQRDGLRIFGVQHSLDNINVINVRGKGFNIGGRSNTSIPGMAPSDYNRLRADHCGAEGFIFGGSSDSHASQIKVRDAGQLANATYIAIRVGPNGTLRANEFHVWNSSTALRHECGIEFTAYDSLLTNAHFEGAQNCQIRLSGGRNQISNVEVYNQWTSGGGLVEILGRSNKFHGRAFINQDILPSISVFAVILGDASNEVSFTNLDLDFYNTKLGAIKIVNHSGYLSGSVSGDTTNYTSTQNRALVVNGNLFEGKDSITFATPQYRSIINGGSINTTLGVTAGGDLISSTGNLIAQKALLRDITTAIPAESGSLYRDTSGFLKIKI